jgi:glycoprotein endo-alpha-1,2-mannosidase
VTGRAAALALALLPALLAGGAWRLERDFPGWRHPGLWGSPPPSAPVSGSAPLDPLVLAVHYPWYGTPEGPTGRWRHWDHARLALPGHAILGFHDPGRGLASGPDVGSTHRPLGGPYDSRDPAVVARQLGEAREAGVDVLLVSWWGRERPEAAALDGLFRAARSGPVRLAPYYETGDLWRREPEGVAQDLLHLLERYRAEPAWLRVGGVPVVFLYAAHRLRPAGWSHVRRRLAGEGGGLFLVAEAPRPTWVRSRPGWAERFDALHVYTPAVALAQGQDLGRLYAEWAAVARAAGRPFVPAVGPGFDDRVIRTPATVVPRHGGHTYDATWSAALSVTPSWVLVSSWNEWHEGSEIEPSREHGRAYLEATRRWADRFRASRRGAGS